jgi:2-hydroxychromene-2-carboxylate isomerase
MAKRRLITVYSDYKSPYAYLAKDLVYALSEDCSVTLEWKPYVLDIPQYLGSATIDAAGNVLEEDRNAHQWRRVRYSYMDCRRQGRKQGLIIRGPRKILDSALASAGMLFAQLENPTVFRRYIRALLAPADRHRISAGSPRFSMNQARRRRVFATGPTQAAPK